MNWKYFVIALTALGPDSFAGTGLIARGGLNLANQADVPNSSSRTGINLALLLDIPINEIAYAMIGGGFENKGSTYSYPGSYPGSSGTNEYNYFVVPLLVSLRMPITSIPNIPDLKVFADFGVVPALTFSASSSNIFDLNLAGEIGGGVPISQTLVGIAGIGYSYGLLSANSYGAHNYVTQFFIGLRFNLPESKSRSGPV